MERRQTDAQNFVGVIVLFAFGNRNDGMGDPGERLQDGTSGGGMVDADYRTAKPGTAAGKGAFPMGKRA